MKKMLGLPKALSKKLTDLLVQYDYYIVPRTSKTIHLSKWEDYQQNAKLTKGYPKLYKYQKLPTELIHTIFTSISNLLLSKIRCQHQSHTAKDKPELTLEHAQINTVQIH